jgi:hypothetical protein
MAPHELIAPEGCLVGNRAEGKACESSANHASRVLKHYLQQKNEILTKDELRRECIIEEVCRKHLSDVPLALPLCQLPNNIPSKADPKRALVNIVVSCPSEARDVERPATQRGCNSHSPELTVWSELCHVPSAQQVALPGTNTLF